jgi:calcium-dependent protein kinase
MVGNLRFPGEAVQHPTNYNQVYTQSSFINRGAYGSVYRTFHKAREDWRAVKVLKKHGFVKQVPVSRIPNIDNEITVLKSLQGHQGIVQYHEAFENTYYVFIVMDLLRGLSLREVADKGPLDGLALTSVVRQIADILFHCHTCDVLVRDVKPDNFVFKVHNDLETLKAVDFGASVQLESCVFQLCEHKGTYEYCAPEVLQGEFLKESDVYSLGILTCELLLGKLGEHTTVYTHPKFTKLPKKFQHVIMSMIQPDPRDRMKPAAILNELS